MGLGLIVWCLGNTDSLTGTRNGGSIASRNPVQTLRRAQRRGGTCLGDKMRCSRGTAEELDLRHLRHSAFYIMTQI